MDILKPDFDLFKKKYKLGKRQILYTSLAADVHTPVSSLIKLEKEVLNGVSIRKELLKRAKIFL